MRSYRIVEYGSPETMRIAELPDLVPGENEVVVNVAAAAVGFVDTLVVAGRYQNTPPVPFAPGMELAGTVRAVGDGVSDLAAGDRVTAYVPHGAFAGQAFVRANEVFPVPNDVPLDQTALLGGTYLTAHFALVERGQLARGDAVLVGGAGGAVGLAAVQLARALGTGRVLGTYRSPADREAILAAGADAAIDISGPDLRDNLRREVLAATDGHGADVVVDPIGGEFLQAALRATAWGGRVVVLGFAAGEIPTVKVNYLLLKNIAVAGLEVTSYRERRPDHMRQVQAEIFRLWQAGKLNPRVARVFGFEEIPQALAFVAGGGTGGRALVMVDPDLR